MSDRPSQNQNRNVRKRNRNKNRRNRNKKSASAVKNSAHQRAQFWGDAEAVPEDEDVIITTAPSAVVKSLGRPPFAGPENIAEHYFDAVYDRAVLLAGALAAAGGLIDSDEISDDA